MIDDSEGFFVDSQDEATYRGETFRCRFIEVGRDGRTGFRGDAVTVEKVVFCPRKRVEGIAQNDVISVNGERFRVNHVIISCSFFARVNVRRDSDEISAQRDTGYRAQGFKRPIEP